MVVCDSNLGFCGDLIVKIFFGAGLYLSGLSTYLSGSLCMYLVIKILITKRRWFELNVVSWQGKVNNLRHSENQQALI